MLGTDVLTLQNESAIAVWTETLRSGNHILDPEAYATGILRHQVAVIRKRAFYCTGCARG